MQTTSSPRVWVIIPAYDEERLIGSVVSNVQSTTQSVVVVDDCSHDNTQHAARRAGAHVLRHQINRGQGAALRTGTEYALRKGADIIVHFDADGQHDSGGIPALVEPIMQGRVDVVLGSRFFGQTKEMSTERRIFLQGGVLFTRIFSGIRLTDTHNGFRAFSRHAAQKILIRENRYAHASEILHEIGRHKLSYVEIPVVIRYTNYSMGKEPSSLKKVDSSLKRTVSVLQRLFWRNLFL